MKMLCAISVAKHLQVDGHWVGMYQECILAKVSPIKRRYNGDRNDRMKDFYLNWPKKDTGSCMESMHL